MTSCFVPARTFPPSLLWSVGAAGPPAAEIHGSPNRPVAEDFAAVSRFFDGHPELAPTPLLRMPALASRLGLGAVLAKDGMEDADADEYKAFCLKLQKAGKEIVEAAKVKNFEAASSAGTAIGKACTECHEGYRSS